jgi:hypothetical protein
MISQSMQFIFNLFGTVHATKDIGKQASGLYALDEKLRVLSNHVDFLLQQHFSTQSCQVKTYDVYTSDDVGCEDREGGEQPSSASDGEEDGGEEEVDADVPAGNTETGRDGPGEGQAGAGSGEAPANEGRADAPNHDGQGRGESS